MNVSEWADTPLLLVLDDTEGAADLVHFVEKIYPAWQSICSKC
jgi:hypothetical protein